MTFTPAYDAFGRMTRSQTAHGGSDIINFAYTYDSNSNIISQQFVHRNGSPYNTYTYDALDRLTLADYLDGGKNEQFSLDDLGNRDSYVVVNGSTTTYTYDSNVANEYTQVVAGGVTHTPLYDDAGNITRDAQGYYHYYDYENRLIEVKDTNNNNTVAQYSYDALGRRNKTSIDGQTIFYFYDGWRVLSEYDGSFIRQRDYVYGNTLDEVLIKVEDTASTDDLYYAHDHLFSPVALIEDDGDVVERYEYDAYGQCNIWDASYNARSSSSYNNVIAFTGQRLDRLDDGNLLIMYYKNRIYVIAVGRFAQRDPLGIRDSLCIVEFTPTGSPVHPRNFQPSQQYHDGMSLYQYCGSNILNCIDPFGFSGCPNNTCNRWSITPKSIYSGGYGLAYVGMTTKLEADKNCCLDKFSKEYYYNGIGVGVGISVSFGHGGDTKWFNTSCIKWGDHLGSGRLTSAGISVIKGLGLITIDTPQTYQNFLGEGWGVDASIVTTLGTWEF